MISHDAVSVTQLLQKLGTGDRSVSDEVIGRLYGDLRRRAQRIMGSRDAGMTLQPTALVHEAYVKLIDAPDREWANRAHFLSVASLAMRQILLDHVRAKNSNKRNGGGERVALNSVAVDYEERAVDLLQLDDALHRLNEFDTEMARAVELRFFAGATMKEAADILGIPQRTAERRWQAARAWLLKEIDVAS